MDKYRNFVKPAGSCFQTTPRFFLNGEEAKRIYIEEITKGGQITQTSTFKKTSTKSQLPSKLWNDKELILSVQNNKASDVQTMLNDCPEKVNLIDEYGWSLLMIACQANAVDCVKVLLDNNANTCIKDKAGNTARSLIIQNKNVALADLFLKNKQKEAEQKETVFRKSKRKDEFSCVTCENKKFTDKEEHLSSTIHNINASKGIKRKYYYKIPITNRGYQIMLRNGWDRDQGLGKDGCGEKYPIRTIQKLDKKGLGLEKVKAKKTEDLIKNNNCKKETKLDYKKSKRMEINFRREFY